MGHPEGGCQRKKLQVSPLRPQKARTSVEMTNFWGERWKAPVEMTEFPGGHRIRRGRGRWSR